MQSMCAKAVWNSRLRQSGAERFQRALSLEWQALELIDVLVINQRYFILQSLSSFLLSTLKVHLQVVIYG